MKKKENWGWETRDSDWLKITKKGSIWILWFFPFNCWFSVEGRDGDSNRDCGEGDGLREQSLSCSPTM